MEQKVSHIQTYQKMNDAIKELLADSEDGFHHYILARLFELEEKESKYEETLRNIDTHIRSTPEPLFYIIKELKNSLPEYNE